MYKADTANITIEAFENHIDIAPTNEYITIDLLSLNDKLIVLYTIMSDINTSDEYCLTSVAYLISIKSILNSATASSDIVLFLLNLIVTIYSKIIEAKWLNSGNSLRANSFLPTMIVISFSIYKNPIGATCL
jgi:hypothetical protein